MTLRHMRLLIAGYYGFGNLGDEAILTGLIAALHQRFDDPQLTVLSGDPDRSMREHLSVTAIHWQDLPAIIDQARQAELILLGGGGLFQDYWEVRAESLLTRDYAGLTFFGSIPLLAYLQGAPCQVLGIGLGPLRTEAGRQATATMLSFAEAISVRDPASKELLESLGLTGARPVEMSSDLALLLEPASPIELDRYLQGLGLTLSEDLTAVNLRYWDFGVNPELWPQAVGRALDGILERESGQLLLIPFQAEAGSRYENDLEVLQRAQSAMAHPERTILLRQVPSPALALGLMGRCRAALVMRLHAAIFAGQLNLPTLALAYDPKVSAWMTELGWGSGCLTPDRWTPQDIQAAWEHLPSRANLDSSGPIAAARARLERSLDRAPALVQAGVRPADTRDQLLRDFALTKVDQLYRSWRELESLRARSETARTELETQGRPVAERRRVKLQSTINELTDQIARLEKQGVEHNRQIRTLRSELDDQVRRMSGLNKKLVTQKREVRAKTVLLEEYQQKAAALDKAMAEAGQRQASLEDQVERKDGELQEANNRLEQISQSVAWSLVRGLWIIRLFLAPHGSFREQVLKAGTWGLRRANKIGLLRSLRSAKRRIYAWLPIMSWYGLAFDRFKRARLHAHPPNTSSLRLPAQRGLVSIVLPVHNGANLLREALESILSQTYAELELIAINDGSTDITGEILEQYAHADARIKVVHQSNEKLPRSLSRGFRLARGEFLTWTSCDNRLAPTFLEEMVGCLNRHPCWDMAYANLDIIGESGGPLRNSDWYSGYQRPPGSEHIHLPGNLSELNTWPNNFIGAAFLYRNRVAWLLGDYSPKWFTVEDYDHWMKVNSLFNLQHADFNHPVYEYRFHSDSLTGQDDELGITRNRVKLMIFDDFRRDSYVSPLVWSIEGDTSDARVKAVAAALRNRIQAAGGICLSPERLLTYRLPRLWTPVIQVRVSADEEDAQENPGEIVASSLKAIVLIEAGELPAQANPAWDTCMVLGDSQEPKRLAIDYQGWICADGVDGLFTALDIRARTKNLLLLENEIDEVSESDCKISVVICTYKPSGKLAGAVEAIAQQSFPRQDYELLIVNNAPDDMGIDEEIAEIREAYFKGNPNHLRLVDCPVLGISHARNAGVSESNGEVICFLDDDSVAQDDLLERIWQAFVDHPGIGVVGGHIVLKPPEPRPKVLKEGREKYWSQFLTGHSHYTEVEHWWDFPWGANWSARRKALLEIGGFRSRYGRRGDGFLGGEELIAAGLIQRLGYGIAIEPRAQILHDINAERYTLRHMRKTILAGVLTSYRAQEELYIDVETGIRGTMMQTLGLIGSSLLVPFSKSTVLMRFGSWEMLFHVEARFHLLAQIVKSRMSKLRSPIGKALRKCEPSGN